MSKPDQSNGDSLRMTVPDAIAAAGRLCSAGRYDKAELICRQIIKSRPRNSDAHNILGVVLYRKGQADEGVKSIRRAIQLTRDAPSYYSNLGEIERQRGNLDAAETALNRAVGLDPTSAQAFNNLGIVYYDKRDFEKASESYRKSLAINPNYAEAHNNLANVLRAQGKFDEAVNEYELAIESRENYPEAYNNMGTVFRDSQKFEEAELSYRRAITLKGDYLEALNNLGALLVQQDRYEEGLRVLADTLKLHPGDAKTLVNIARTHLRRGAYIMAERAANMALESDPESIDALCIAGQAAHDLDKYDASLDFFERALDIESNNIEVLNHYGIALKSVGRLEDARNAFLKALELVPTAMGTYSNIVDLEKFTAEHPLFNAMVGIWENVKDKDDAGFTALHFALGKAYEDVGDYNKAFFHVSTGARFKRATLTYDEAEVFKFYDDIMTFYSREYFEARTYPGNPTHVPIFVIGMPRSGSTLTEQIISSHPQVYGAGEIKVLSQCLGQLRQKFPSLPRFPAMASALKPSHLTHIANGYLTAVIQMSNSAERVTDKLLTNYFFVGLINTLFPNAKFIHTKRNPVDTCLSTYTKLFKDDMPHSYNLGELGRYYCKYEEIMTHWHKVLPEGVMLDVQYEETIADPEANARRIIEFCELEWDPICLSFHESNRPVKTASVSQVRKPIYSTSVERWRRYGANLNPLLEALGRPLVEADKGPAHKQ